MDIDMYRNWGLVKLKRRPANECHCKAYASVADIFCKDCKGTGRLPKNWKPEEDSARDE